MENWDDLRFFLAVARSGNLSSAAAQLATSVSTAHRRVGSLEESLRTRLFDRRPRGYLLTPAGEALLALATDIETRVLQATRQLSGADLVPEGVLRVTAPHDVATSLLADALIEFREAYPGISVELNSTGKMLSLSAREADVAIRAGAPPTEPDVIARKVDQVAAAVYASRDYLERHGRPESYADLAKHDLVMASGGFANLPAVRFFESHVDARAPRFRCGSFGEQKRFVELGFGLAMLPCMICRDVPELVQVFDPLPEPVGTLFILVHRDLRNVTRVRVFVDFMFEALVRLRPVITGQDAVRS